MSTLIVYSTKSGATRLCAERLAARFPAATVATIKDRIEPTRFDAVVAGSGIRSGKLYRPMLRFLTANEQVLLAKPLFLFTCNAFPDTFEKSLRNSVPPALLCHASCTLSLGGLLPFRKDPPSSWLDENAFERLCAALHAVEG